MSAFGFVRYRDGELIRVGVCRDDQVTLLSAVRAEWAGADLAQLWPQWDTVVATVAAAPLERGIPLDDLDVLPVVDPRQLFQAGANYRQHVIDLAAAQQAADPSVSESERRRRAAERVERRIREGLPYVFSGMSSSLAAGRGRIEVPAEGSPDWEIELAVVFRAAAYRISAEQAASVIGGYAIANDLTLRDNVYRPDMPAIGTDWLRAKNPPGFTPIGPMLVPQRFVDDAARLRLVLRLNGEVMQDAWTDDMMFSIPALIAYISATVRILPGDVLLTGSPAGNGIHHGRLLRPGDRMESEITGLGLQRHEITGGRS